MARRGDNIYLRRDGRYEGRYKKGRKEDGSLHYGYVYGRTKKAVLKELARYQKRYTPELWKKEKETVSWWLDKWLNEWMNGQLAVTSFSLYERMIRLHILPFLGNRALVEINEERLRELTEELKRKKLANRTVNYICSLLGRALKQAWKEGWISKVPELSRLKEEKTSDRVLNVSERKKLDVYLSQNQDPAVAVGAYLGLRLGEVCALKWEDLDFENGYLYVRRSVQYLPLSGRIRELFHTKQPSYGEQLSGTERLRKTAYVIKTPKTAESTRMLPLPEDIVCRFQRLREEKGSQAGGYVFGTGNGTSPAKPRTMQKHFSSVSREYLGKSYGFHALRHTFATRFMENCDNAEMLRSLLGHSNVNTTLGCYVHSDEESKRKAMEKMMSHAA